MPNPKPVIWMPVTIDSSNNLIEFDAVIGAVNRTYTATIASATYYDPATLSSAVGTAIQGATRAGPGTFNGDGGSGTVSWTRSDGLGRLQILNVDVGSTVTIRWASLGAVYDSCAMLLGFSANDSGTADAGGDFFATADHPAGAYTEEGFVIPNVVPRSDDFRQATHTIAQSFSSSGASKTIRWGDEQERRQVVLEHIAPARVFRNHPDYSITMGTPLEAFWKSTRIARFAYFGDSEGSAGDEFDITTYSGGLFRGDPVEMVLDRESAEAFNPRRMYDGLDVYALTLIMRPYVA